MRADHLLEAVAKAHLCSATCAHDPEHGCVISWQASATEQLEAIVQAELLRNPEGFATREHLIDLLRRADDALGRYGLGVGGSPLRQAIQAVIK
jgi:hypothetical protein